MSDGCRRERGAGDDLTLRIESMMVSMLGVVAVLVSLPGIESNREHA